MNTVFSILTIFIIAGAAAAEPLVLKADKDGFGRSNKRNRNSGACGYLIIAPAENIRSLIAFDLSAVTNEIISAEFRFRQQDDKAEGVNMIVAPMVSTDNNHSWKEGSGNLGLQGQNARPGESCYAFNSFPDKPWESASGQPVSSLGDAGVWLKPITALIGLRWENNRWVRVPINDLALLERIRKSDHPTLTLGLWGNAGNGLYRISSNNSKWAPELRLHLRESAEK
mgnify:CR=1 FL=1